MHRLSTHRSEYPQIPSPQPEILKDLLGVPPGHVWGTEGRPYATPKGGWSWPPAKGLPQRDAHTPVALIIWSLGIDHLQILGE